MKGYTLALLFFFSSFSVFANEQSTLTVQHLATDTTTRAEFKKMFGNIKLPSWVTRGGVNAPTEKIQIKGKPYLVLSSCKPHDCGKEHIAVLYSLENKTLSGVISTTDDREENQHLIWLNVPDNLTIDGKTALFSALSGSLDNHPDQFSFN